MKVKFHFIVFFISIGFTSLSQINFNESFLNNNQNNLKTAYFASGCFWCVEAIFENVNGVVEVFSGYSGGKTVKPSYKQIMTGKTGHAETTKIVYNPKLVAFKTLVDVFFGSHDPTTLNRQGPDVGTQYRSIAFYQNDSEKEIINNEIQKKFLKIQLLLKFRNLMFFILQKIIIRILRKKTLITHISEQFQNRE